MEKTRSSRKIKQFQTTVLSYYREHGRHELPWRKRQSPYRVLVSELMLQQTQVERVVPKYQAFLKQFPSVEALARAPLGDVLRAWQGLGYNRRAKYLWECARVVVHQHNGRFPKTEAQLRLLPGIGPYTAAAICAFAHNEMVSLLETNVRTVFVHHFYDDESVGITDAELYALVTKTLPTDVSAREWYAALMDYGSYIKRTVGNHTARTKSYAKQSTFTGSDRQIRGALIKLLGERSHTKKQLQKTLALMDAERVEIQLGNLVREGLVVKRGAVYALPH